VRVRQRAAASVLGFRDFRLLWLGQTISTVGDQIFPIAVAVKVLDAGGNASDLGLVLAARWMALVLFVVLGGVYADRLPRKLVMMGSDAFRGVAVLALALTPGEVPVVALAALTFLVGGGEAFFRPAYGALLPSTLPEERLGAGNALTSISVRGAAVLGPAVAGVLVATVGTRPAFLLDAATFAVSMATLARLHEPPLPVAARSRMLRDIRDGAAEVWRRPWVLGVLALAVVQLMLVVAPELVLLPIISRREFGSDAVYGIALAAFAAGGVAGALLALRWRPARPGLVSILGLLPFTLVPLALAFPLSPAVVVAAYVAAGIGIEPFIVYWAVALQREIPRDKLARVTSLDWLCSFALLPLGLALVGPAVEQAGEDTVLLSSAAVNVVSCLAVLAVPGILRFSGVRRDAAAVSGSARG